MNSQSAIVSIIVPVYNCEKWLEKCLDSILLQSYKNIEVILIDDGSSDNSGIIADRYARKCKKVKVIHKANEGASIARNCGMYYAKGKYIQFVDSDDIISNKMTEKLVDIAESQTADFVMCDVCFIQEKEAEDYDFKTSSISQIGMMDKKAALSNIITDRGYRGFLFNKLFRKEIIDEYKLELVPEISVCEDLLFCCEYLKHIDVIAYTNEKLYGYIKHKNSISNTINGRTLTSLDAKKRIVQIYDQYNMPEGRSWYVYSLAFMLTFIDSDIIKQRKKELIKELQEKKKWFNTGYHTKKERIVFACIYRLPVFGGYCYCVVRKVKNGFKHEGKY